MQEQVVDCLLSLVLLLLHLQKSHPHTPPRTPTADLSSQTKITNNHHKDQGIRVHNQVDSYNNIKPVTIIVYQTNATQYQDMLFSSYAQGNIRVLPLI